MKLALRLYRWFAEAFPHEFKMVYGADVVRLGEDAAASIAREKGLFGLVQLVADIAICVLVEYASEIRADAKQAFRRLYQSPGFTLVGVLSLGLAMGVSSWMFSRLWNGVFRDIPSVTHPGELVMPADALSYPYIERFREHKSLLTGAAAVATGVPFNVSFGPSASSKTRRIFGQIVSPDYFSVLGVQPQRGRVFSPMLDRPGGPAAVVISDQFWRARMNGAPDALGQTLRLNGRPAEIVGIGPPGFRGVLPSTPSEIFVPLTVSPALAPELAGNVVTRLDAKIFVAVLRLAPRVSIDSAEAGLDTIVRQLEKQEFATPERASRSRRVTLLEAAHTQPVPRKLKAVVLGFFATLTGLILGIACLNLGNMSLARAAARQKEFAIRLAIGASRFRLIRQLLTEGVLLAIFGGLAGFALGTSLSAIFARLREPSSVPIDYGYSMDWRVGLFTIAVAVLCGIGFSLVPALQATKSELAPTLKQGAALALPGFRRFGIRNLLVVGQVAGSLLLLLITGFLLIGFANNSNIQIRFDARRMSLASIDPVRDGYAPDRAQAFFEQMLRRLRSSGASRRVALAAQAPFSVVSATVKVTAVSASASSRVEKILGRESVGAGYFEALNEPVLRGREFDERDGKISPDPSGKTSLPAVLNETAAQGLFGAGNPVGQRLREDGQVYEIVGVVPDFTNSWLVDDDQDASMMYLPLTPRDFTSPPPGGITVMVRSESASDTPSAIEREIASMDPKLAVFHVQTLADQLERSRASMRASLDLYMTIGVFGMILAAIGLAGVTAHAVARRRKEIGIRMALGARKSQVLRLVLREGAALVAAGTIFGFIGAMIVVRLLSAITSVFSRAFQVSTNDPRLIVGAPLLLGALAMIACYIPARKSAAIDPLAALRNE